METRAYDRNDERGLALVAEWSPDGGPTNCRYVPLNEAPLRLSPMNAETLKQMHTVADSVAQGLVVHRLGLTGNKREWDRLGGLRA